MPTDAWITLATLIGAIVVLVFDRFPIVVVIGAAVGVLMFTDVVDESIALAGFSSSAPVTVAALYVLAGAAAATGALGGVIDRVLGSHGRLSNLTVTAAGMSAVMPNTPVVALFAPRVVRWARRNGRNASKYLLPLSYASVLGGVVTLIGTSTNLIVSDLLRESGRDPLGMFEMTPVGLPVAIVGLGMIAFFVPRLVPNREPAGDSMREAARRFHVVMTVDGDGPLIGQTVADAGLRDLEGVYLAAIERHGRTIPAPPHLELDAGDECFFVGDVARVIDLQEVDGLTSAENSHVLDTEQPGSQLYEAVISEYSSLVGRTLKEVGFRAQYHAAVLAIHRPSEELSSKLGNIELRAGDSLLVLGGPGLGSNWRNHPDFALVASLNEPPPPRRSRAWLVTVAVVAMVVVATLDLLSLFEASIAAAALVVAGGALSLGEARRSVNLNVVLTIALSISLGLAVQQSGLAAEIADVITAAGEPFGTTGQVVALVIGTIIMTEVITNNAAAALMVPVALAIAAETGNDPRALTLAVLIGASASFLSPVGYQTNLMVYSLGGYRYLDFTKVGFPLTIATIIVTSTVVSVVML